MLRKKRPLLDAIKSKKFNEDCYVNLANYFFKLQDAAHEKKLSAVKENYIEGLREYFSEKGLYVDFKPLTQGVSNNMVLSMSCGDESYVVQVGMERPAVDAAIQALASKKGKLPAWLAPVHNSIVFSSDVNLMKTLEGNQLSEKADNHFEYNFLGKVSIIDRYESLEKKATELRRAHNLDELAKLSLSVARQLPGILKTLSENNVLWTDLKERNILLQGDNVIIADKKAFRPIDQLLVYTTGKIFYDGQISEATLSSTFEPRECTRGTALKEWEKEYSYQLAHMLYFMATGFVKQRNEKFEYSNPVFSTTEGVKLKFLIEALGRDDPADRMSFEYVAEFLNNKELQKVPLQNTTDIRATLQAPRQRGSAYRSPDAAAAKRATGSASESTNNESIKEWRARKEKEQKEPISLNGQNRRPAVAKRSESQESNSAPTTSSEESLTPRGGDSKS